MTVAIICLLVVDIVFFAIATTSSQTKRKRLLGSISELEKQIEIAHQSIAETNTRISERWEAPLKRIYDSEKMTEDLIQALQEKQQSVKAIEDMIEAQNIRLDAERKPYDLLEERVAKLENPPTVLTYTGPIAVRAKKKAKKRTTKRRAK